MWPSQRRVSPLAGGGHDEEQKEQDEKESEAGGEVQQGVVAAQGYGEAVMEGVEHLGQYVFEMTKTRVQQLREEKGLAGEVPVEAAVGEAEESYGGGPGVEEDVEEEGSRAIRGDGFEVEED